MDKIVATFSKENVLNTLVLVNRPCYSTVYHLWSCLLLLASLKNGNHHLFKENYVLVIVSCSIVACHIKKLLIELLGNV